MHLVFKHWLFASLFPPVYSYLEWVAINYWRKASLEKTGVRGLFARCGIMASRSARPLAIIPLRSSVWTDEVWGWVLLVWGERILSCHRFLSPLELMSGSRSHLKPIWVSLDDFNRISDAVSKDEACVGWVHVTVWNWMSVQLFQWWIEIARVRGALILRLRGHADYFGYLGGTFSYDGPS